MFKKALAVILAGTMLLSLVGYTQWDITSHWGEERGTL